MSSNAKAAVSRVAVGQMTATGDQQQNLKTCSRLAKEARARGCSTLFLPECFSYIGLTPTDGVKMAQPLTGPLMQQYQSLASSVGIWLSLGGFQERSPTDPDRLCNCHVILDDQGSIRATYRKVHLFDVEVENGPVLMESRSTAPGNELVACDSPAGRLGLTICYDLRFPEVYQALTFQHQAEVLLVPSAFTKLTGEAHWELLLRARAVECQCYVIAAAQAGKHNEKRESYGHSLIIDPWGRVIGKLDDPSATGIAVADIDPEELQRVRRRMPIQQHRIQGRTCLGWDAPQ
ncbi:hypothetical protein WJX74_005070 [Apatococcus lobatus]|uniref:CN hydrolase domain-containing protein n=1 Tax=Apatococcus lobatus TaxID=904363 RepID=A0AAW1RPU5_9CHLO